MEKAVWVPLLTTKLVLCENCITYIVNSLLHLDEIRIPCMCNLMCALFQIQIKVRNHFFSLTEVVGNYDTGDFQADGKLIYL